MKWATEDHLRVCDHRLNEVVDRSANWIHLLFCLAVAKKPIFAGNSERRHVFLNKRGVLNCARYYCRWELICICSHSVYGVAHQLPAGVWQEQAQTLTSVLHVAVADKWTLCWVWFGKKETKPLETINDSSTWCVTLTLELNHWKTLILLLAEFWTVNTLRCFLNFSAPTHLLVRRGLGLMAFFLNVHTVMTLRQDLWGGKELLFQWSVTVKCSN